MRVSITKEQLALYGWLALGYFLMGSFTMIGKYPDRFFAVVVNNFWGVIYVAVVTYFLFEYTNPYLLKKRKSFFYNILIAIPVLFFYMILYSYGSYLWRLLGIELHIYTPLKVYATEDDALQNQMGYSTGGVVFFGIIRHIYKYIRLRQSAQQLRIEKQEAELNYLRSQTNPHFLFNTLNNIYSLARDKSDLAPTSILNLSKILRFMLYETSGQFIAIGDELKIINDYIALEKLRYDESLRVNFNHDVEDMKQSVPPLLLIPLVENAFKHGVSETRDHPFVDIHLSVNNRQLNFVVKNSTDSSPADQGGKKTIGLANVRRQLELLYRDYDLSVEQSDSVFTAILKINLASHVENKMYSNRR
jgi:sensor histidine kinase YesM